MAVINTTETGVANVQWRYYGNAGTNVAPFRVMNPNSTDDSRLDSESCSVYKVTEIKN